METTTESTLDATAELVAQSKCNYQKCTERLLHVLSFVPDDKLTWKPSATAKSALEIIAHCAVTNGFFSKIITGTLPEPMPTIAEYVRDSRAAEGEITTRESAIALLKESTGELCKAVDTVTAENIPALMDSPFGALPMRFWIGEGRDHLFRHSAQLEYLQTIWGDMDDHMG